MRASGVAQRRAGGQGAEAVLCADLVEQREHLLLAACLVGDLGGGLADGRGGEDGEAGEQAEKDFPHASWIDLGSRSFDPRKRPLCLLVFDDSRAREGAREPRQTARNSRRPEPAFHRRRFSPPNALRRPHARHIEFALTRDSGLPRGARYKRQRAPPNARRARRRPQLPEPPKARRAAHPAASGLAFGRKPGRRRPARDRDPVTIVVPRDAPR